MLKGLYSDAVTAVETVAASDILTGLIASSLIEIMPGVRRALSCAILPARAKAARQFDASMRSPE
jgi:hypothetical protein